MRVWHNLLSGLDVIEYVPKKMYGVIGYKVGKDNVEGNRIWYATQMSYEDVLAYTLWCDTQLEKEIYNRITRKPGEKEWK